MLAMTTPTMNELAHGRDEASGGGGGFFPEPTSVPNGQIGAAGDPKMRIRWNRSSAGTSRTRFDVPQYAD